MAVWSLVVQKLAPAGAAVADIRAVDGGELRVNGRARQATPTAPRVQALRFLGAVQALRSRSVFRRLKFQALAAAPRQG